jgi:hypothetical protein
MEKWARGWLSGCGDFRRSDQPEIAFVLHHCHILGTFAFLSERSTVSKFSPSPVTRWVFLPYAVIFYVIKSSCSLSQPDELILSVLFMYNIPIVSTETIRIDWHIIPSIPNLSNSPSSVNNARQEQIRSKSNHAYWLEGVLSIGNDGFHTIKLKMKVSRSTRNHLMPGDGRITLSSWKLISVLDRAWSCLILIRHVARFFQNTNHFHVSNWTAPLGWIWPSPTNACRNKDKCRWNLVG